MITGSLKTPAWEGADITSSISRNYHRRIRVGDAEQAGSAVTQL